MAGFSLDGLVDDDVITSGLQQPISLEFLPDGRMLVLEKDGKIFIADPETGNKQLYLQLNDIDFSNERGLLDIAIDPDFGNGSDYIYLFYTPSTDQHAVIARFEHQENAGGLTSDADGASPEILWKDTDGYTTCCHYGGGLDFGPDGNLWLTSSDKFNVSNPGEGAPNDDIPLDLSSTSGKIIRIEKDGSIPADNPFVGADANNNGLVDRDEGEIVYFGDPGDPGYGVQADPTIWAYGFRNPFRAEWDLVNGLFYIGEVGGNQGGISHENIHVVSLDQAGAFYGWPFYENGIFNANGGNSIYDPADFPLPDFDLADPANGDFYSAPIYAYARDSGDEAGASLTGGFVYRGNLLPSEWNGVYFYGDYTEDEINYLTLSPDGRTVTGAYMGADGLTSVVTDGGDNHASNIVYLGEGPEGAIYYISYAGAGAVRRIDYTGNQAPIPTNATIDLTYADPFQTVTFTYDVSDPDGDPVDYTFTYGDGATTTGTLASGSGALTFQHAYSTEEIFEAYLSITDGDRSALSQPFEITVGDPNDPPVIENSQIDNLFPELDETVTFTATATDLDVGDILTYTWDFGDGNSALGTVALDGSISVQHTYTTEGLYPTQLTVTDGEVPVQSQLINMSVGLVATEVPIKDGLVLSLESFIKVGLVGDTVSAWLDTSGLGNNLSAQGNPTYVQNATPGGQPAILFDGTDDLLERINSPESPLDGLPSGDGARTVFFVVDYMDGYDQAAGFVYGSGSKDNAFGLAIDRNDGNLMVQGWGAGNDQTSTVDGVTGGFLVQSVVVQDGGDFIHYLNGAPIDSGANNYNTLLDRMVIGGEIGGYGDGEPMSVAAVVVYDRALSETERSTVEDYLQNTFMDPSANVPPVAVNDAFQTDVDTQTFGNVLLNDTDANGDTLEASLVSDPSHGSLLLYSDGSFDYTPDNGYIGADSFTYSATDNISGTDQAVATIDVQAIVNDLPVANNDSFQTDEDTAISGNVLLNDTDPDGDTLTAALVAGPSNGSVVLNSDGSFTYTPDSGYIGTDSFTYDADDSISGTDQATATIFVQDPTNPGSNLPFTDGLVASYDAALNVTFDLGGNVDGWLDGSGFGIDLSAAGDPQLINGATPTGLPAIYLDGDGDFLSREGAVNLGFLPDGSSARTIFFVADYLPGQDRAGGIVYGNGANDQAFGLALNGKNEDLMVQGWGGSNDAPSGVNGVTGDFLVQSVVMQDGGAFDHYLNGQLIDTGSNNFNTVLERLVIGEEIAGFGNGEPMQVAAAFIYDGALTQQQHDLVSNYLVERYITGPAANTAPVATDDSITTYFETPTTVDVLANDSDADNDTLTVTAVTNGANGTATIVNNEVVYTPDTGFSGDDTVTYTVDDGNGGTDTGDLTVTVLSAPNQDPVVTGAVSQVFLEDDANGTVDLLLGASDPDGDTLHVANLSVSSGDDGGIVLNGDELWVSPSYYNSLGADESDVVSYSYEIADGFGGVVNQTATITINGANDLPVAVDDSTTTDTDTAINIDVLANDSDPDGEALTPSLLVGPTNGSVVLNPDNTFTYTPNTGFQGDDSFTYEVTDGTATDSGIVDISVGTPTFPTTGLVLHLDSTNLSSLTLNGSTVEGWADLSGNGNDVRIDGAADNTPTYQANFTQSGAAAISFDGVGDFLERETGAGEPLNGLPDGDGERTLFFVVDYQVGQDRSAGFVYGAGVKDQAFGLTLNGSDGELMVQGWGASNDRPTNVDGVSGGFLIQSVVMQEGGSFEHYLDDQLIDTGSNNYNTVLDRVVIGEEIAGYGNGEPMDVAAVLVYDHALSAAEHQQVLTYLQETYTTDPNIIV